ncbi:TetR/AcrR family transcriptional regulator [Nocardioides sp. GCM10028917]|uniref:TetR/AcrR family transcriptional regulator n=1 Tax=Nocardioides sp. GCM10028917 TaxID=3273408 RepID=UPI00360AFDE1
MVRPRTVSDDDFIQAAATAAARRADGSWSLAEVAAVVGLTPAAVVKRFGSKRGLLLAVVTAWERDLPDYSNESSTDPLALLREWVGNWLAATAQPDDAVGHLTLLLDEVVDDETRPLLARGREKQARYLQSALIDAHQRGQLRHEPPANAGELWLDLLAGATITGAIEQSTRAATRTLGYINNDIERWTGQ